MAEFEPKQFGKYFLIDKLAVGGMAEIYKAKTFGVDGFEKELAIKRILPHCAADKDFITMLIAEAKLSVLLSHANIVQVYDLGKVEDDYFISMEFIHGVNLRDILYHAREAKIPIPLDIAVYIVSEVCKGLDYAHRKTDQTNKPLNIVHRDVSPQNVLISYEGEVKIVDFGIAKAAMNISHTMAGILKGKIAYMSPEQALGKAIDSRTDIFSTGILLYEVITGTKLFTGESQFEVLKKIRTTHITPDNLPDSVPAALKPIVAKALAYSVEERYQNAGDFQIDLTKFLYSTYVDFSPRKLAAFIRKIFATEIKGDQMAGARGAAAEQQTSSMDIIEGAKQVEIVHNPEEASPREDTARTRTPEEDFKDTQVKPKPTEAAPPSPPETTEREKKRVASRASKALKGTIWLAALIAAVAVAMRFVPTLRFWEGALEPPPAAEPSVPPVAQPPVASPPAVEKPPALEPKGVLSIISEPIGAAIMVDGRATGKVTPAAIENLPIGKEIRIAVSKPDFSDFEQSVTLGSAEPQTLKVKLSPISQPKVAEPAQEPAPPVQEKLPAEPPAVSPPTTPPTTPPAVAETPTEKAPSTGPAAEEPAKAPVEAKIGSLSVSSKPSGARISIDGRRSGKTTPATIPDLKIGATYSVRFDLEGYRSATRKKTMREESESLYASLAKEEAKPPEPAPPAPESQPSKPPPEQPKAQADQKGKPGSVRVTSSPSGADVFINGDHKGRTPLTASVTPGRVSVLVSKDGMRVSRTVTVKPGQTVSLTNLSLSSTSGEVVIKTEPPRARVVFDGQTIPAQTPVTIRKVPRDRQHSFTVTLDGYRPASRSFTMDQEVKSFNITLQPQ
ncbi:MAG TPA: PEGA domain-containing protein [bacterium]|nr:PEGA domain-containing protein [bacterium]